jgi:hypothetical protein
MNAPQTSDTAPAPARRIAWDRIVGIAAVVVGACALAVSFYTARLQRTQIEAQIWPTLTFQYGDAAHGIRVSNKGTGPALIGWTQIYVDGQPVDSWAQALGRLGPRKWLWSATGIETAVLSPGEVVDLVHFDLPEDYAAFTAENSRVSFEACYCSLLKKCDVARFSLAPAVTSSARVCESR